MHKDIPIVTGAVGDTPDPGQPRRLRPLGGVKPKRPMYELPTPPTLSPGQSLPGAGTQPVTDRFAFERPTPTYPAPGRPLPGAGTQSVTDRFAYELPTPTYPAPVRSLPVIDRFAYELPNLLISGQGRLPLWTRTQPMPDRFMDDPPDMPYPVHDYDRLPPRVEMGDSYKLHMLSHVEVINTYNRPPEADYMDTVAHL